jgi:hypothetical protein
MGCVSVFKWNPLNWTQQILPENGGKILSPIRLVLNEDKTMGNVQISDDYEGSQS